MVKGFVRAGVLGAVVLLSGCALGPVEEPTEYEAQYWPAPPDLPRYKHVFTLKDAHDIRADREEQRLRQRMTGERLTSIPIPKPFSLAARDGRLYISDTAINRIHAFDFERRRYFQMGYRFEGELSEVSGIAVDDRGWVYAVDRKKARVVMYDPFGLYMDQIKLPGDVKRASGVAVAGSGERIYVVDTGGVDSNLHRVLAFDAAGELVAKVGQRGAGEGSFNLPVDVEVGPDGLVYVLDAANFLVQVFDAELNFIREWGGVGSGFGQFARPRSIAVGKDGVVYVSDAQFANVQLFDTEGRLLMAMGKRGALAGELELVAGVAVDERGNLYVADQRGHKIEIYSRVAEAEAEQALAEYRQRVE